MTLVPAPEAEVVCGESVKGYKSVSPYISSNVPEGILSVMFIVTIFTLAASPASAASPAAAVTPNTTNSTATDSSSSTTTNTTTAAASTPKWAVLDPMSSTVTTETLVDGLVHYLSQNKTCYNTELTGETFVLAITPPNANYLRSGE